MIARLLFFVFGYLLMIGAPATAIIYAVHMALGPSRKRKHAKKLAEQHAKLLTEHILHDEDQQCFHCSRPCTELDCYEEGKGWYHASCMKELLGS